MRVFLPCRELTEHGLTGPWAHIWDGRKAKIYAPREWKPTETVEVQLRVHSEKEVHFDSTFLPCLPGKDRDEFVIDFSPLRNDLMENLLSAWVWLV